MNDKVGGSEILVKERKSRASNFQQQFCKTINWLNVSEHAFDIDNDESRNNDSAR